MMLNAPRPKTLSDSENLSSAMAYGIRLCTMTPEAGEGMDRNGRMWRWHFGENVGPLFVDHRGEPLEVQPIKENHPAWEPFNKWLESRRATARR